MHYYVNLDRSPERRSHMEAALAKAGIEAERIAAVDGSEMSEEERRAWSPPGPGRLLLPGEIGCFLSHRRGWERFLATEATHALFMEDDAVLSSHFGDVLRRMPKWSRGTHIVQLEVREHGRRLVGHGGRWIGTGHRLRRLHDPAMGTAAYVLSRDAAEMALARSQTFRTPVDAFLFVDSRGPFGGTPRHIVLPGVVIQADRQPGSEVSDDVKSSLIGDVSLRAGRAAPKETEGRRPAPRKPTSKAGRLWREIRHFARYTKLRFKP